MKTMLRIVIAASFIGNLVAQESSSSAEDLLLNEHGKPDFQGTWWYGSRTPLQRPKELSEKKAYTPAEAAQIEQRLQDRNTALFAPLGPDRSAPEKGAAIRQEADDNFLSHFQEPTLVPVNSEYRTSIIFSPADGRLPRKTMSKTPLKSTLARNLAALDGPEGQPLSGRCLAFGAAIPSLTPIMMNPNLQIVQTEDHIMIMTEMVHDVRVVKIYEGPTAPEPSFPKWMGDSRGYWDDATLVIQSRNFRAEQTSLGRTPVSDQLEITERLTLTDDNNILYGFEVRDPVSFSAPIYGERVLTRNEPQEKIYEFACHEGNYSLANILMGARRQEFDSSRLELYDSQDQAAAER